MEKKVETGSREVDEHREQEDEVIEKQDRGIEEGRKIGKQDRRKRKITHKPYFLEVSKYSPFPKQCVNNPKHTYVTTN